MKTQAKLYWPLHEILVFIALLRMDVDEVSSQTLCANPQGLGSYRICDQ